MSKWQTRFQTEPTTNLRKVFVDEPELGEIVCRVYGTPDKKVQEDRARLIASAPTLKQQRDDLREVSKELAGIFPEESMSEMDAADFKDRANRIWVAAQGAKAAIAKCL